MVGAGVAGVVAWALTRFFGAGPLRADAVPVGALVGLLVLGARFVRLRPPPDRGRRNQAVLSRRAKGILMGVVGVATVAAVLHAVAQAREGYVALEPAAVLGPEDVPLDFYAATGVPMHEALYRIRGTEGDRYLVPLDTYEGLLLVVTNEEPPTVKVRVTGRLRDDLRTVQKTPEGQAEGPFVPLYREHMGLPDTARVYFLDTSVRAGLNVKSIALAVTPLYVFLLLLGAPTRRPG